jgi:hypothetical protein
MVENSVELMVDMLVARMVESKVAPMAKQSVEMLEYDLAGKLEMNSVASTVGKKVGKMEHWKGV